MSLAPGKVLRFLPQTWPSSYGPTLRWKRAVLLTPWLLSGVPQVDSTLQLAHVLPPLDIVPPAVAWRTCAHCSPWASAHHHHPPTGPPEAWGAWALSQVRVGMARDRQDPMFTRLHDSNREETRDRGACAGVRCHGVPWVERCRS